MSDIEYHYDHEHPDDVCTDLNYDEKNNETQDFYVKNINIKDFCNILTGFTNIPNINNILLQFTPEGMTIYAKPIMAPVIVNSFWNKDMFQEYKCSVPFIRKWVTKDNCSSMRKQISKDVDYIIIKELESNGASGFEFSGERRYKTGGQSKFSINLFTLTSDQS